MVPRASQEQGSDFRCGAFSKNKFRYFSSERLGHLILLVIYPHIFVTNIGVSTVKIYNYIFAGGRDFRHIQDMDLEKMFHVKHF